MYEVKIADMNEFRNSQYIWNKLVLAMPFPSIFCTWEWIYTWRESFGNKYECLILMIYKDTELKAILPLASQKVFFKKKYLFGRLLSYCGSMDLYPDHVDIICAQEDIKECLDASFHFLFTKYRCWDVLYVPLVLGNSYFLSHVQHEKLDFCRDVEQSSVAPFITLSGNFKEYIGKRNKKFRDNLKSRRNKLYRDFGMKYESFNSSRIEESLNSLFYLHGLRANKKGINSTFSNVQINKFHHNFAARIQRNGWLSINFLKNENDIIAASYNFVLGGTVFSYQKGIHPAWEKYGPGAVLLYELINEAFTSGNREYNFLQGDEGYKYQWTEEYRRLFDIHIYNRTIKGSIVKKVFRVKNKLSNNFKKILSTVISM